MICLNLDPDKIMANPDKQRAAPATRPASPKSVGHVTPPSDDRFVSRQWLANHWDKSTRTIRRMEQDGLLQPIRIGKRIRFSMRDILRLEEAGRSG